MNYLCKMIHNKNLNIFKIHTLSLALFGNYEGLKPQFHPSKHACKYSLCSPYTSIQPKLAKHKTIFKYFLYMYWNMLLHNMYQKPCCDSYITDCSTFLNVWWCKIDHKSMGWNFYSTVAKCSTEALLWLFYRIVCESNNIYSRKSFVAINLYLYLIASSSERDKCFDIKHLFNHRKNKYTHSTCFF